MKTLTKKETQTATHNKQAQILKKSKKKSSSITYTNTMHATRKESKERQRQTNSDTYTNGTQDNNTYFKHTRIEEEETKHVSHFICHH